MDIVLTCGTENEKIEVLNETSLFVLESTRRDFHTFYHVQDYFKSTSTNSKCGIKSIGLFSDYEGLRSVGEVVASDGDYGL